MLLTVHFIFLVSEIKSIKSKKKNTDISGISFKAPIYSDVNNPCVCKYFSHTF